MTKPKLWRLAVVRLGVQQGPAVYRWADSAGEAEQDAPKWMRKGTSRGDYAYLSVDEVKP